MQNLRLPHLAAILQVVVLVLDGSEGVLRKTELSIASMGKQAAFEDTERPCVEISPVLCSRKQNDDWTLSPPAAKNRLIYP